MINKFKNLTPFKILFLSFSFVISIFLFSTLTIFFIESYYKSSNKLINQTFYIEDFELYSIVLDDGKYLSSDSDPQMVLEKDLCITDIVITADFSIHPGEMVAYYTTKEGEGFSSGNRVWFIKNEDGTYTADFTLLKNVNSIRIDPTNVSANYIDIESITINTQKSFTEYFKITPTRIYHLFLISFLISIIIGFFKEVSASFNFSALFFVKK